MFFGKMIDVFWGKDLSFSEECSIASREVIELWHGGWLDFCRAVFLMSMEGAMIWG